MQKIILTDADGVLFNWNEGFEKFITAKGYSRVPGTEHEYSISKRFGIGDRTLAGQYIREFNECSAIGSLNPFLDSVEYVRKLHDYGFKFIVVTSISGHPESRIYRMQNLKDVFGDIFDEVHCLEMGHNKFEKLSNWADSGYFWIEDSYEQAEAGHKAGLRPILVTHAYNYHYDASAFTRVSPLEPWKEIHNIVCKEYNIT